MDRGLWYVVRAFAQSMDVPSAMPRCPIIAAACAFQRTQCIRVPFWFIRGRRPPRTHGAVDSKQINRTPRRRDCAVMAYGSTDGSFLMCLQVSCRTLAFNEVGARGSGRLVVSGAQWCLASLSGRPQHYLVHGSVPSAPAPFEFCFQNINGLLAALMWPPWICFQTPGTVPNACVAKREKKTESVRPVDR